MTILDKVIAAVTPPESQEERQGAPAKSRATAASAGDAREFTRYMGADADV